MFLSLSSAVGPAQVAFVAAMIRAIASHDMTPIRIPGVRRSSPAPLELILRLMQTCVGTIVIAMARNHVLEGIEYVEHGDGQRYRDRHLTTEWIQIETALAYQRGHPILVLRENLVHPAALLDPATSRLTVLTFSLQRDSTGDVARIAKSLAAFRARLRELQIAYEWSELRRRPPAPEPGGQPAEEEDRERLVDGDGVEDPVTDRDLRQLSTAPDTWTTRLELTQGRLGGAPRRGITIRTSTQRPLARR